MDRATEHTYLYPFCFSARRSLFVIVLLFFLQRRRVFGAWSLYAQVKGELGGEGGFVTIYLYHVLGGTDWELPGWRGESLKGVICLEFGETATLTAAEIGYILAVFKYKRTI
jgi:hypothetical protein